MRLAYLFGKEKSYQHYFSHLIFLENFLKHAFITYKNDFPTTMLIPTNNLFGTLEEYYVDMMK